MQLSYLDAAMSKAHYEILADDRSYYGEVRGFSGVLANATTLEECRNQLREVLEEWILVRVSQRMRLPTVNGLRLSVRKVA